MRSYCTLLGPVVLLALACSDPEFPPPTSGTDPLPDAGARTPATCFAGGGWSCEQVGDCAADCGIDENCVDTCRAQGCAAASAAFDAVRSCVIDHCIGDCIGGATQACEDCSVNQCPAETQACVDALCTGGEESVADGGPMDCPNSEPPPPNPPTGTGSCGELLSCVSDCGLFDDGCSEQCADGVCQEAIDAADRLGECAEDSCPFECLFPDLPGCTDCLSDSCADEVAECAVSSC